MTDKEKLEKLVNYIEDFHECTLDKKSSFYLTEEQIVARLLVLEDILSFIDNEIMEVEE